VPSLAGCLRRAKVRRPDGRGPPLEPALRRRYAGSLELGRDPAVALAGFPVPRDLGEDRVGDERSSPETDASSTPPVQCFPRRRPDRGLEPALEGRGHADLLGCVPGVANLQAGERPFHSGRCADQRRQLGKDRARRGSTPENLLRRGGLAEWLPSELDRSQGQGSLRRLGPPSPVRSNTHVRAPAVPPRSRDSCGTAQPSGREYNNRPLVVNCQPHGPRTGLRIPG